MKKTYADICLERANDATPGPWTYDCGNHQIETLDARIEICDEVGSSERLEDVRYRFGDEIPEDVSALLKINPFNDMEFIAHARTDVEQLAIRLNVATSRMKTNAHILLLKNLLTKEGYDQEIRFIDSLEVE